MLELGACKKLKHGGHNVEGEVRTTDSQGVEFEKYTQPLAYLSWAIAKDWIFTAFWYKLGGCLFLVVSYDMKKLKKKKKKKDIDKESPVDDFVNSVIKGIEKLFSPR